MIDSAGGESHPPSAFKINARDIVQMSIEQCWQRFVNVKRMTIVFDDGEMDVRGRYTLLTAYAWRLLQRYPYLPILKKYHVSSLSQVTPRVLLDISERIVFDARDYCEARGLPWVQEDEDYFVYKITNDVYNMVVTKLQAYVVSFSILEFIELCDHPPIKEANDKVKAASVVNADVIEQAYSTIKTEVGGCQSLTPNWVVKYSRAQLTKINQLIKSVGPVGYVTDIDSHVYHHPIRPSYVEGMTELWQVMLDSRTASTATLYADIIMPLSEFLNRASQLVCSSLRYMDYMDCGSNEYMLTYVKSKRMLKAMEGIYYLDGNNQLQEITGKEEHLVHKEILHRSPLYCQHPNRLAVCSKCYGEVSKQMIYQKSNVGHVAVTELAGPTSQHVLSYKHNIGSAVSQVVDLDKKDLAYLSYGKDSDLFLNKDLDFKNLTLRFAGRDAPYLEDIRVAKDISKMVLNRITNLDHVVLSNRKTGEIHPIYFRGKNRTVSLTLEMLQYIKEHGWEYNEHDNYEVDLRDWNSRYPFVDIPQTKYSPPDFIEALKYFLLSSDSSNGKTKNSSASDRMKKLDSYASLDAAVAGFYDLVGDQLETHYSHLQAIVLSMCVEDKANNDYRLPKVKSRGRLVKVANLMTYRSMGVIMAFAQHARVIFNPASFVIKNRSPHPLDPVLMG